MAKQRKRTRRRFSDEFKAETVKLAKQSDRSMADLAMELGINAKSLGEWVKKAEESGQSIEEDERAELRRLRKENAELRMEREILKKRRPSSRKKVDEVRVHRLGEGFVSPSNPVSGAPCLEERLLRVAATRPLRPSPRG